MGLAGVIGRLSPAYGTWRTSILANGEGAIDLALLAVTGGAPFSSATRVAMTAFADGKYSYDAFFETGKQGVRRGVIWNFRSGKIAATWDPEEESCGGRADLWSDCKKPAAFTISTEGNYSLRPSRDNCESIRLATEGAFVVAR